MKKVVVHNDRFHADDVFAIATLKLIFGDEIEVIRTRDDEIVEKADMVLDYGGIYDPEKNRFDHHQKESAGKRENGIPYASFGLIWKHFGKELCGSDEAHKMIDRKLVQSIDAGDNGFSTFDLKNDDYSVYLISDFIMSFNPTWKEGGTYDEKFDEVLPLAMKILEREIAVANDKAEAIPFVEKAYEDAEDKRLIVLDKNYPWESVLPFKDDTLFVISPSQLLDKWRINAIQEESFKNRKDLPEEWGGLRGEELQKVSGVSDAVFCHRNLFMAVANTKEGIMKMAEIALNK